VSDPRIEGNLGFFCQATAARVPDKTALIDLHGGREKRLSYAQLEERLQRVAGAMRAAGLAPGDRIALMVGNRSEYVELFFGAMRAGVLPVPANTRLPLDTLEYILRDSGSVAAAVDPSAHAQATALADRLGLRVRILLDENRPGWIEYESALAAASFGVEPPTLEPDAQAFQPYTAGSTGRPKGVMLTHRGMLWSIRMSQRYWPVPEDEIALLAVPLFHKNAMRGTIKPLLYAGGAIVMMPGFEPRAFLEALAKYRCTYAGGVPAVFTMLLRHVELMQRLDFSALRLLTIGSAVVPHELIDALERTLPGVAVKESYGLTEGGGPLRAPLDGRKVPRGSCGVAAPEHELKLIDSAGREHPRAGELWIRCPYVPLGYHNQPALTAERIVAGWLKTGDLFEIDADGFWYFKGRVDDMFSCGGENIYPKEVENLLFRHPAVADAVVAPIPHAVKGFAPAALVVLRDGAAATAEELKQFCLANGPAYAHPRRIEFVAELPLTGAGKLDRNAVKAAMAAPMDSG
jgi:acyl-CoA synthetase (AMP-forming)/AMP-acid ligase II